jgi:uncharacterized protein (DUF362 family)
MNWNNIEQWCNTTFSRKGFLKIVGASLAFLLLQGKRGNQVLAASKKIGPRKKRASTVDCDLAVIKGNDPRAATRQAVAALGGISRFVRKGDSVVVKPNIGWDRSPEQGANTHPDVVAAIVQMCREAGAKTVKVYDNTCNNARRCYENSGIAQAAQKAGATVTYVNDWQFYPANLPENAYMSEWPVFKDAVECDCFINVPVAKHHGLTKLTLSIKNLMGVCGGIRGKMHGDIDQKLAELLGFIQPDLTIIDASRILLRHGPTGGDTKDVVMKNTIIAGTDAVLADTYATSLFQMQPEEIGYITAAAKAGHGSMNIAKAKIKYA